MWALSAVTHIEKVLNRENLYNHITPAGSIYFHRLTHMTNMTKNNFKSLFHQDSKSTVFDTHNWISIGLYTQDLIAYKNMVNYAKKHAKFWKYSKIPRLKHFQSVKHSIQEY